AWDSQVGALTPLTTKPHTIDLAAVASAKQSWHRQLAQMEQHVTLAEEWLAYLVQTKDVLSSRLPLYINLVAATPSGVEADEHFGAGARNGTDGARCFDLLVVEEADQVSEAELSKVAQRARRWVLVGETVDLLSTTPARTGPAGVAKHCATSPVTQPFARLWQNLHSDPRVLPYQWAVEEGRLRCRLRPVRSEQRRWLETERLADSPDIELRILAVPDTTPVLSELVFPPSMTIVQAKQYIFNELQELAVSASRPDFCW